MSVRSGKEDPQQSETELVQLLSQMCDGGLKPRDVIALEQILLDSEEARWKYIHAAHLMTGMRQWAGQQNSAFLRDCHLHSGTPDIAYRTSLEGNGERAEPSESSSVGVGAASDWGAPRGLILRMRSTLNSPRVHWRMMVATVAALLLLSVTAATLWPTLDSYLVPNVERVASKSVPAGLSDSQTVVARIVSATSDVTWANGKPPVDFLMRLRPGDSVETKTGRVTIEFSKGAFLVLHSPALLQVTSGDSARLIYGRVAGRAEQGNFVLLTPQATVVDIGTEFGVDVSKGNTDVSVFEGEVDVYGQMKLAYNGSFRLTQGMKVSIDLDGHATKSLEEGDSHYNREFFPPRSMESHARHISLLDLMNGYEDIHRGIAGSIDPVTGYWGRVPLHESAAIRARRGDTQFTSTDWNKFVDGVFIPRANAREMQINSDGQMVYLPPNSGTTWGPIWARRRTELDHIGSRRNDLTEVWGGGSLAYVRDRLPISRDGILGFHANAGITFDLAAVRQASSRQIDYLSGTIVNLDSSQSDTSDGDGSVADFRVFVDGKLRFSRLGFGRQDGDARMVVPLGKQDRFVTLVTTDADGNPACDHVVVVDPVLELQM